jgi:hypothetical protein
LYLAAFRAVTPGQPYTERKIEHSNLAPLLVAESKGLRYILAEFDENGSSY